MKKYKQLFFDLDGTLTDPSEGITKSIAYALDYFGISVPDINDLLPWIGPPIKQSLMDIYDFDESKADLGVEKYRERFTDIGIYENRIFDGIPDLLAAAKAKGYKIYLATSKPTVFAERILVHFNIDHFFDFVGGSALDDSRPTKAHVIRHVIEEAGVLDMNNALMIGDRKYDILGAEAFQMDSLGVLYGFGAREELESHGATFVVDSVSELSTFLLEDGRKKV